MNNQGVELRAAFNLENFSDGCIIARINAEAVNRFSREGHGLSRANDGCKLVDIFGVCRKYGHTV